MSDKLPEAVEKWLNSDSSQGATLMRPASELPTPTGSVNLADVVKAAWRLQFYGYHDWALAGGLNECPHGIAEGIHCQRCDSLLLRKTYEQLSSPNTERSEGGPTTQ